MIVVVGGSARKAGKTTVMCEIIAGTRDARWTALKITSHDHEPSACGDTERYVAAGAIQAFLLKEYPRVGYAGNVIVESNQVMDIVVPDLFVFVDGGGEWKPSAKRHAAKANYVIRGHIGADVIARIEEALNRKSE